MPASSRAALVLSTVYLQDEITRLSLLCDEIVEEARRRQPEGDSEVETRARILVTWGMHYGEVWPQIGLSAIGAMLDPQQ
jgi:hypothetical protein